MQLFNYLFITLLVFYGYQLNAQTCCTAGIPLSTNVAIDSSQASGFNLQLAYEYNSINALVDNNKRIENDPRSRKAQNLSLKIDYTINARWGFSIVTPIVQQSRNTISENQSSLGIGDLMLITQYTIKDNPKFAIKSSGGIKIPSGTTSHRGSSQILLSPDMQSGSGSLDFLINNSLLYKHFLFSFLSADLNVLYRRNGVNNNFGGTNTFAGRRFRFGDEFISHVGFKYQANLKMGFLTPGLGLKLRWQSTNTEQEIKAPNSGGHWLSLPVSLTFSSDQKKTFRIYSDWPIYQHLNGLQISTNFVLGFLMKYKI